jgi:hypothetical protein
MEHIANNPIIMVTIKDRIMFYGLMEFSEMNTVDMINWDIPLNKEPANMIDFVFSMTCLCWDVHGRGVQWKTFGKNK